MGREIWQISNARYKSMFSSALRPGVALGSYPQRPETPLGALDCAVAAISGQRRQLMRRRADLNCKILPLIHKEAEQLRRLSDQALKAEISLLRRRLSATGNHRKDAARGFAMVQEVASRTLGMRHFDVQLLGGWLIYSGVVAEMEAGEGKTLTATLPAGVSALAGVPVHIVTLNDYLVTRDAQWMAPVYDYMGLTVGSVTAAMSTTERQAAYACDIVYCTNKQLVFDYLRDRLVTDTSHGRLRMELEGLHTEQPRSQRLMLRGLCYAIVDEADSVLVDEARTPLIISRRDQGEVNQDMYQQALWVAEQFTPEREFTIDAAHRDVTFTDAGKSRLRALAASLGGPWSSTRRREELAGQALCALHLYERDIHYLVRDGRIEIIDENTGRTMVDRSWQRNLHQLIEAKEACDITSTPRTLARISYQRFFRRYLKLAGMTGTAREVVNELWAVYGLDVVEVPTHRRSQRRAMPGAVYRTLDDKWDAVVARVCELRTEQRPVLVGTRTLGASEVLGERLRAAGIPHQILNARQDRQEAQVIAQAGQAGCVTVATNMAGRGTDIKLSPAAAKAGGLHVIVTEFHEARRIDRQLTGRSGRQGDPGSHEYLVSLQDELAQGCSKHWLDRLFGPARSRAKPVMGTAGRLLLGHLQRKLERRNSRLRKRLLRADEQLNELLAFGGTAE